MLKRLMFIDTETTGLDPTKNSLWQIGIVYRDEFGQVSAYNLKCKPLDLDNITDEALKVCHTTKEELMKLPDPKEMRDQFLQLLLSCTTGGKNPTWVGYNSKFDIPFVENFLKHFDPHDSIWRYFYRHYVDVYEYMKLLKSANLINAQSLKLGTLYQLFGVDETTAHDAVQDAYVTWLGYQWAVDTIQKGLQKGNIDGTK